MKGRPHRAALAGFLLLLVIGLLPPGAVANGAPIQIVLGYLPGVSNTGPRNAVGVAEIIMEEGELRLSVTGLPRLDGEVYRVWLLNTTTGAAFNGGSFNTNRSGGANFENILPSEIPDRNYNLLILTIEPAGGGASGPGPRRSIGGYFPRPTKRGQLPSQLPRTGGGPAPLPGLGLGALLMLLAGVGLSRVLATRR